MSSGDPQQTGKARMAAMTALWTIIALVYLFPYTWMVLTAFRQPVDTLAMRFVFTPTLDGFRTIFIDSNFQLYLQNSLLTAIPTTILVLLLAAPAAYSLAHLNKRSKLFLGSVLVARMVPGIAILIPLYLAASRAGLLDRRMTLIVVYCAFNLPFAVWLLRGFFREIPNELREAAIVDGCSEFQVFWKIMVPLVGGGLVATSVFVFIGAWNEFLFALALTQSNAATAPLAVIGFRNEYGVQWGAIGAAAVMISTPVVAFAVVMQKYLVRGLTMGAVKG
ncbi:carbohydrate ABC transporter permease [Bosea sp. BK604]|uniref:carbohydrate ABC transporter permease n=1 Tax=Bosea sp. BK604 TaxID=2512180 RepID=UPI0010DF175D|nr:carbohydrate ABC transporter permease [Bosea sp. BK604]TCR64010.1 carbohydrate ABC transporter membrane protein 2 (CUT1 family) [Bosea sp. BK604]